MQDELVSRCTSRNNGTTGEQQTYSCAMDCGTVVTEENVSGSGSSIFSKKKKKHECKNITQGRKTCFTLLLSVGRL